MAFQFFLTDPEDMFVQWVQSPSDDVLSFGCYNDAVTFCFDRGNLSDSIDALNQFSNIVDLFVADAHQHLAEVYSESDEEKSDV